MSLSAESQAGCRPELGRKQSEGEIGVAHEPVEHRLPAGTVAGRVPVELHDVLLGANPTNAAEPSGNAVPVGRSALTYSTRATAELVPELGVRRRAREERMPGCHQLVCEAGRRQAFDGADAASRDLFTLQHADVPAGAGEQRRTRKRVDSRPDEDRVVARHSARA